MAIAQTVSRRLDRKKYQDSRPTTESQVDDLMIKRRQQNIIQAQEAARNQRAQTKTRIMASLDEKAEKAKTLAQEALVKEPTAWLLNILWAKCFTLVLLPLAVCGLNVYLFFSLIFPKIAQFGEDDFFGTALGGGRMARYGMGDKTLASVIEITILISFNFLALLIVAILGLIIYYAWQLVTDPFGTLSDLFGSKLEAIKFMAAIGFGGGSD